METDLLNYYTQLASFSSERSERRKVSDWSRLYLEPSGLLADTEQCRHDCPARRLLADMMVLDWLRTIDIR